MIKGSWGVGWEVMLVGRLAGSACGSLGLRASEFGVWG